MWWLAAIFVLLCALVSAEYFISRAIADKLTATVNQKLDAELRLRRVVYIPPLSVCVWDAELVRVGQPIVKIPRAVVKLSDFPLRDKPLKIASIDVTEPRLRLSPGALKNIVKRGAEQKHPRKASEMLRLEQVRIIDGRVTYSDPSLAGPPTVWDGITLSADTVQQSPSLYSLRMLSRAYPLADMSAVGTIDVDSLFVDVQSLSVKLRAEPQPDRSPLPQAVQEWLETYRVHGIVSVSGNGKIPLRDWQQSQYTLAVALQNGVATLPQSGFPIQRADASLTCTKRPGGPTDVRIDRFVIAGDDKELIVTKGQGMLDPLAGTWSLSNVEGNIVAQRPINTATRPKQKIDRYQIAGRADFAAALSGPLQLKGRDPLEAVQHEIICYPRRASFVPAKFAHRIEDINGEIRVAGGMLIFQELAGSYGGDRLRLRAARLPLKGLPRTAQWQEISGTVTFLQPIRRYSPALDKIFDALNPSGTFIIAGSFTIERMSEELRRHTYDLIVSSDSGAFDLAKVNLPLRKLKGDATITPAGVDVHALQAEVHGGTLAAAGRWVRGQVDSYDGDITLRDVDLAQLQHSASRYGPRPLKGKLYGQATVFGTVPDEKPLSGLRASGELEIVQGQLFGLPVLKEIFQNVKGLRQAVTVDDAAAVFDIADGQIVLRDAAVNAPVLGLQGKGKLGFDGKVNLEVVAAPLADWKEKLQDTKVPVVSNVAGELAGAIQKILNTATGNLLYEFRVAGDMKKLEIMTVPTPVLTDAAAFVFGKMISPKKDQRPLDWFRRDQSRAAAAQ